MATIKEAKESIKNGIKAYLYKENGEYVMNETSRLPFYLEGPPGVGKTEIVKQIADELHIGYVSFSLVHHTRNSLLGLPVITELKEGGKYTNYTMSEIIAAVLEAKQNGAEEGILLLDEFPCVSDTVLPTMLSFLQTKNIGRYTLPTGWVIVLCGNPPKFNKSARKLDSVILDRVRRIEIKFDAEAFLQYGKDNGMHTGVLLYLGSNRKNIYNVNVNDSLSIVTSRSWENLSNAVKVYDKLEIEPDEILVKQYIKNENIAKSFVIFYKTWYAGMAQKDFENLINGKKVKNVRGYKNMSAKSKWMIEECMLSHLDSEYGSFTKEMEKIEVTKNLTDELSKLIKKSQGEGSIMRLFYFMEDGQHICEELKLKSVADYELINELAKYINENVEQEKFFFAESSMNSKGIRAMKKWIRENERIVNKKLDAIAKTIENMMEFLEEIDEGRVLTEKFFNDINNRSTFILAMNKCPKEIYLKYCKERYGIV